MNISSISDSLIRHRRNWTLFVGSAVLLLIAFYGAIWIQSAPSRHAAEDMRVVSLVKRRVRPIEADLVKWAQDIIKQDRVKWQQVTDTQGVGLPPDYGTVKKEAIPTWIRNFIEPDSLEYASVDKESGIIKLDLQYPGGVIITVVPTTVSGKGYVIVWRGFRQ